MKKIAFYRKPWFIVGGFLVLFLILTSIPILLRNEGKEEPTHTQMKYSQQVESPDYPDLIFRKIPLCSYSSVYEAGYAVSVSAKDSEISGEGGVLEIPQVIQTEDGTAPVEAVDDYAFANCSNITEIVLPDSIYSIGDFAFANDYQLTRLVIPMSIHYFGDGNNFLNGEWNEDLFYNEAGIYYLTNDYYQPTALVGTSPDASGYLMLGNEYKVPDTCRVVLSQAFKNTYISGSLDFTSSSYMMYYGSEAFFNMDISGQLKLSYLFEADMPGGFGERIFNPTYSNRYYDDHGDILSMDDYQNLIARFDSYTVLISSLTMEEEVTFPENYIVADGALIGISPKRLLVSPNVTKIGENLFGHPAEYSLEYYLEDGRYAGINTLESIQTFGTSSYGRYAACNNILYDLLPVGANFSASFDIPNYHKIVLGCKNSEFVEHFPEITDPNLESAGNSTYDVLKNEYAQWLSDLAESGESDLPGYYLMIGAGAFSGINWDSGISIELPDEIAEIGRLAFFGSGADTIRVGAECEYIGYGAFSYSLTNDFFLDSEASPVIAPCAFANAYNENIFFPETVSYIGYDCFEGAYVSRIVLPKENRSYPYDTSFIGEIYGDSEDFYYSDDGVKDILLCVESDQYDLYFQNADETNRKYLTYEVLLTLNLQSLNRTYWYIKLYNQSIQYESVNIVEMYGHAFNEWTKDTTWYNDYFSGWWDGWSDNNILDGGNRDYSYFLFSEVDGLDIHDGNTRLTNTRYNISEITLKSDSFNLMNKTYDGSVYQPSFSSSYVTRNLFDFEYYGEAPTVHENRLVAPTVAGTYTANLTFKDSLKTTYHEVWSWDSSVTGDIVTKKFTISPRAVEIKILNVEQTYGNQAKNYTLGGKGVGWEYVSSNHLIGDDVERSVILSTEATSGYQSVGKYPITATFSNPNYTVTFTGDFDGSDGYTSLKGKAGIFEITPAEIGVTLGHSYVYQYGLNVSHELKIKEEHLTFQGDVAFASAQVKYTVLAEYHSGDEENVPPLERFDEKVQSVSELGTYIIFYCITAPNHKQKIDYAKVQVVNEVIEISVDSEKMLEFVYGSQGITSDALIDLLYEKNIIKEVFVERRDTSDGDTLGSVIKEPVADAQNQLKQYAIFAIHDGAKDMTNQTLLWSSNYVVDVKSKSESNGMDFDFYDDKNPKIKITPKELNLSDIDWQETADDNNPYEQTYNKGIDTYGHHHPNPIVTQKVLPDDQVLLSIQIYVRADHSLVNDGHAVDVGEYEVKIEGLTGSAAERYTLSTELKEASKELNIHPRTVQMTWTVKNALYDGNYHKPDGNYNHSDILPGDEERVGLLITSDGDNNGGMGHINVGKYNYQATLQNKNYVLSEPSIVFEILPRSVEIRILNVEKAYGDEAKNYTFGGINFSWEYASSNQLLSSDLERSITFSTEAKNGYQSVGKYPITANFSDSNYTVTFIGDFEGGSADVNGHAGIFEIVPAEIGVTLGHSYVYQYGLNVSHDLEIKEEHLTFQGDVAFASAQVKYTALAEYHSGDEEKIPLLENFTAGVQTVSELGTYILFYCITAPNHEQKIDYAMVQVVDEVIEIKVDSEKMLEFVYGSQGITSDALIDLLYEKGIILEVFVERQNTSDEHTLGSVTKEEVVDAQNKLKQYAIFAIHDGVKDMTNQTLLWSSNYVIDVTSNGDDNGMVFDFYEDKNPKIKITPKELNLSDIDWQETEDENNPYEQIYNKGLDEYGHHHPNPIVTQKVSPDDQVLLSIKIYVRAGHSLVSGDCAIDVGEYEVKIEGLTGSAAERYTLSTELKEASKELNILPRTVQMTWSGKNALYDGSYHFPTGDYNRSDILPGDEGSINFSITSLIDDQGGLGHINVGKYNYQATLNNKNYVLSEPSIIFEISKGLQEFELHQDGTIFGTPLPSASFTGDQTGGVTYLYERIDDSETYQSSVAPTDAGNYRLTVTLGETELYQASSQSVTFTISKAQADGSVEISSWTYGAVSSTPQATTNFGQVTILYSADGTTYTEEKPQNAGHYYIKAVVAGTSNYIGFEKIEEFDIYKACYLENEVEEPDFPETLTYTKGLSLENISLAENYRFADPNQVLFAGTQEITIYYNADPTNYENFAITKTITIAKGNYENMSYETITVTYKEGMTLADVGLSQGFRWEDDTTGLDIGDGQIFRAIYNDDSKNFNDYHLEIVLNVRGEIARNPLEGMEMGAFVLIASVEVLAMITMIVLVIRRRKRND